MAQQNKKVLLHACCAVCLGYSAQKLLRSGYDFCVYFFNPNIYPNEEYERRKLELVNFCEKNGYEYIVEDETYSDWCTSVKGYEDEPEKGKRCDLCFEYRLKRTKETAEQRGFNFITTTLTISPHKVSKNIFAAGRKVCEGSAVEFLEIDFKKEDGFLKTNKIAKEFGLYRQTYCGCSFSKKELKTLEK